ncbi:MAG TPA: ABC transporter permease [Actinotalea sp.]
MTALTTDRPTFTPSGASTGGVTFPRVVSSEWLKFRTVRSTVWTLATTLVLMVGISVLIGWGLSTAAGRGGGDGGPTGLGAVNLITGGYFFAQLTVAVLGVLAVTAEYTTGMIRSTFAAVPRRIPALLAKALVVTVAVAVVSTVGLALAYVATIPFLNRLGLELDLSDPTTVRVLLGTPLYLSTVTLLAFAIGALLRHSAGALATVLGLLLVVENVFRAIPLTFFENVSPFLPSTAGGRLLMSDGELAATVGPGADLTPWQGYGVMLAWALVLLAAAIVLLRRRDA